jgi:hypothetical protein
MKYLLIKDPTQSDAEVMKVLEDWGYLSPEPTFLAFLRQSIPPVPAGWNPADRLHRPSMKYLRDQEVYELFYPTNGIEDAWGYLSEPSKRMVVEQILLARLDLHVAAQKVNRQYNWHLTEEGLMMYRHYFWNVKLLTFDEWGRYLYGRSAMYDRYMALLHSGPKLAFFHLRLEQTLESKKMIQRTQEIAYFALEEVNLQPGVKADKVKAIGVLGKVVTDCHNALSTSDMALSAVLKEFERFRMEHPELSPPDIKKLAPNGNYSGSGVDAGKEKVEHH